MSTTLALQSIPVNTDRTLDVQRDVQATDRPDTHPSHPLAPRTQPAARAPLSTPVDLSVESFPDLHHFLIHGTLNVDTMELGQDPAATLINQICAFGDTIEAAMANLKGGL